MKNSSVDGQDGPQWVWWNNCINSPRCFRSSLALGKCNFSMLFLLLQSLSREHQTRISKKVARFSNNNDDDNNNIKGNVYRMLILAWSKWWDLNHFWPLFPCVGLAVWQIVVVSMINNICTCSSVARLEPLRAQYHLSMRAFSFLFGNRRRPSQAASCQLTWIQPRERQTFFALKTFLKQFFSSTPLPQQQQKMNNENSAENNEPKH